MKSYLKLVSFEFNRFFKMYLVLIGILITSQLTGVIVRARGFLKTVEESMREYGITQATFLEEYGAFSFDNISRSIWFIAPIALAIIGLLIYMFLIWYRDWYGKNTFIYRLLTLPTARLNIYFAKATALLLMIFGLISVQLLLLPAEMALMKSLVPVDLRIDLSLMQIIATTDVIPVLIPTTFFDFTAHYLLGSIFVFVIFTAILFERSLGILGIILGVLYSAFSFIMIMMPLIITAVLDRAFLYPMEYFFLEVVLALLVLSVSIMTSRYLLNEKITV